MNHFNATPLDNPLMDRLIQAITYLLALVLGALLFYCASLAAPYPYADDWIYASAPPVRAVGDFISWLFSQYVDHRIPLQKAAQLLLLRLSGFDFRWLIALNVVLALGNCWIFIELSRVCRGHRSWMDVCIPLIALNPALPPFFWGFQMQFVVPTFAVGASMLCMATRKQHNNFNRVLLASTTALIAAASGMNGVITASICLIAIVVMIWRDQQTLPLKKPAIAVLIVSAGLVAALWLTWTPSAQTSSSSVSMSSIWIALRALATAGLASWLYASADWKMAVQMGMLALGAAALAWQFYLSPRNWMPLCIVAAQSLSLLLAAAFGRSGPAEWTWMHALHYGFIASGLSIAALTAISASGTLRTLALPILAFFGYACLVNSEWRLRSVREAHPHIELVTQALATEHDADRLASEHMQDFWWIKDDHNGMSTIASGIRSIRSHGYWQPKSLPPAEAFLESKDPMKLNSNCNIETLEFDQLDTIATLRVSGWLLREDKHGAPTTRAWLVWRDKENDRYWRYPLSLDRVRNDIPGAEKSPDARVGFQFVVDVSALPAKSLPVTLDYNDSGYRVICDNGRRMKHPAP